MHRTISFVCLLMWSASACAEVDQGAPNADFSPAFAAQTRAPAMQGPDVDAILVADGLAHPWGMAALPDGAFLVTERPGRLRLIDPNGRLGGNIAGVPRVDARGQGGLLDVAVGPNFADTRRVYLTYAKPVAGGTVTAAGYGVLSQDGRKLTDWRDIFIQHPPSPTPMHYGSRIVFSPDAEHVFITTGEHSTRRERVLAQDLTTTYGKVLRLTLTGDVPPDNPFVGRDGIDAIWSFGHRNVQGAAIAPDGTLWTIEHGPRGGDELNQTRGGRNYGWPVISYGINYRGSDVGAGIATKDGMEQPTYYWDPVIAPGGMAFYAGDVFPDYRGDLLIGGLMAGALVRLSLGADGQITGEERILRGIGRVRDVEVTDDGDVMFLIDAPAPDGGLYKLIAAP